MRDGSIVESSALAPELPREARVTVDLLAKRHDLHDLSHDRLAHKRAPGHHLDAVRDDVLHCEVLFVSQQQRLVQCLSGFTKVHEG